MKALYLNSTTRKDLLERLGCRVNAIFADPGAVALDFGADALVCSPKDEVAASQNERDEVIWTDFRWEEPANLGTLRAPPVTGGNLVLTGLRIVDTIVLFTDHERYTRTRRALRRLRYEFVALKARYRRSPGSRINAILAKELGKAIGGHSEMACHPEGDSWRSVDPEFVNHVEVGVVFEFDDLCLAAFVDQNAFFMAEAKGGPLVSLDCVLQQFGADYRIAPMTLEPRSVT